MRRISRRRSLSRLPARGEACPSAFIAPVSAGSWSASVPSATPLLTPGCHKHGDFVTKSTVRSGPSGASQGSSPDPQTFRSSSRCAGQRPPPAPRRQRLVQVVLALLLAFPLALVLLRQPQRTTARTTLLGSGWRPEAAPAWATLYRRARWRSSAAGTGQSSDGMILMLPLLAWGLLAQLPRQSKQLQVSPQPQAMTSGRFRLRTTLPAAGAGPSRSPFSCWWKQHSLIG